LRPRRTTLFEQDEPATAFYLVLDGWVKLFRMTAGGDEVVVGVFARGDCIAEVPCLTGGAYPVSGETVTDARLLAVPTHGIVEVTRSNPQIGLAMLASTSLHLKGLVDQIEELKAHTGPQRLANFLIGLAPVAEGPCTIALPYEKLLIAGRLGMKPESLSRSFQRLRAVGVRIEQGTVVVNDMSRLAEFAGRERLMAVRCPLLRTGCRPG
jgi:CRP-like cAMP-binding protein